MSLNNQSGEQSAMGQRAEALASIQEAVRIYGELAQSNPAAFLPNLATSIGVLGDRLAESERLPEARDAAAESLRFLAPFFTRYPGVHDGLAKATCNDYLTRSQRLGLEPEADILAPYARLFQPGASND